VLLVVSNASDVSTDYLVLRLQERRIPYFRLNTERLGVDFRAEITVRNQTPAFLIEHKHGRLVESSTVTSAYLRDPRLPTLTLDLAEERQWAETETAEFLRSLWRLIPDELWLNAPSAIHRASNKVEQLLRAAAVGLTVPETRIGSGPDVPRDLLPGPNDHAVAKALRFGFIQMPEALLFAPTRKIDRAALEEIRAAVPVPTTFQELLLKRTDIRVTLVGDRVFATNIFSQAHEITSVDWRTWDYNDIELRHEAYELPQDIADRCIALNRSYGLGYSAIDMVHTTDGRLVFLELNPTGQWAWIEQMVGYQIRDAIIDYLMRTTR
jgi:glutathione synthase/RimK-type ligase-like ATP-grasp enzyme